MQKIANLTSYELKWEQPSALKMEYQLRAGDDVAATLRFRSSFGTFAVAESADGCWTFKRVGFFQTRVTIRHCNTDVEVAVFKPNTWSGGGTLILASGQTYRAATNFWQTKFTFETEAGDPLLSFQSGGFIHQSAIVSFQPNAAMLPDLPLMVLLGWYLIIMMHNDSAATVAAAT